MLVSKISLGGANFGDVYGDFNLAKVELIVKAALDSGINLIDTAYWYGQGKSEERLGQVLEKIDRSKYYMATKVGRYEKDFDRMFDFGAEKTERSLDESLLRLKLPYVDIIQVHDTEYAPDERIILEETLPSLEKARDRGKARYIGLTGYSLDIMRSIIEKSKVRIDTVIVFGRANLHDDSYKEYLSFFKDRNIGIINSSTLSMGLLTPQGPPDWHFASKELRKVCKEASEYCQLHGYNIADLARRYGINFPGVETTLVGVDSVSNLTDSLKALEPASDAEIAFLNELRQKFFQNAVCQNWESESDAYKSKIYEKEKR